MRIARKKIVTLLKLRKFLVDKFNEEYQTDYKLTDFDLTQIPLNMDFMFAFEASAEIDNINIHLEVYFSTHELTSLTTFELETLDNIDPSKIYYVTRGTISSDILSGEIEIDDISSVYVFQIGSVSSNHYHVALMTNSQLLSLVDSGIDELDIESMEVNGHTHIITIELDRNHGGIIVTNITNNDTDNHTAFLINGFPTNANHTWTKSQRGAFIELMNNNGYIDVDLNLSNNFYHQMTENVELLTPTNVVAGQSGIFEFIQGETPYELTFSTFYKFPSGIVPTLTQESGHRDIMSYIINYAQTSASCTMLNDMRRQIMNG